MALDLPEGLVTVVEFQHVKPGKGGAFVRTKLKNVPHRRGHRPHVPRRREGRRSRSSTSARCSSSTARAPTTSSWTTRPTTSCTSTAEHVGNAVELPQGRRHRRPADVQGRGHRRRPARRRSSSTSRDTEPGIQGDRVSGARKPATLETGLVVQVPLFVNVGEQAQGRHPHRASTCRGPEAEAERGRCRPAGRRGNGRSVSRTSVSSAALQRRRRARRAAGRARRVRAAARRSVSTSTATRSTR